MKVLDRYLIRELALPIFVCCISLVFLILIADLFDNLDELLKNKTPLSLILNYYLCLVPFAFSQTIAWSAWLGTLFLLVNFGFHNETIAMKAAGLKITTIVKPILYIGFLLGIVTFLVNDWVLPKSFRKANEIKARHIDMRKDEDVEKVYRNVTYHSAGKQLYYFRTFSKKTNEVEGAVILSLTDNAAQSRNKMLAKSGVFENGQWIFKNVTEYQTDSRGRILGEPRTFDQKIFPEIQFTPEELASSSTESDFLTYGELQKSIQKLKKNGVRVNSEAVDLHYRLAQPWQAIVMMLIAIPLLARTTNRKAIALNVLYCVAAIFAFHVTSAVGVALGKAGKVFPFLGAWSGNILFSSAAFFKIGKGNF